MSPGGPPGCDVRWVGTYHHAVLLGATVTNEGFPGPRLTRLPALRLASRQRYLRLRWTVWGPGGWELLGVRSLVTQPQDGHS
jgi:hypothetical protein